MKRYVHSVLATVAVALTLPAAAQPSEEKPAERACPSRRTVLTSALLFDHAGNIIGELGSGATPRFVAPGPADLPHAVEVEIDHPAEVRALVGRHTVVVFARAKLDVVPGFSWVRRGTPLVVVEEGPGTFQVTPFLQARHLAEKGGAVFEAGCENLQDESLLPLADVVRRTWDIEGTTVQFLMRSDPPDEAERVKLGHRPSGMPLAADFARLPAGSLTDDRGHSHVPRVPIGVLLREEGERALIHIQEDDGLVVEGWVDKSAYEPVPAGQSVGWGSLCCSGTGGVQPARWIGRRGGLGSKLNASKLHQTRLKREVSLASRPGAAPFAHLRKGTLVEVYHRVGDQAHLAVRGKGKLKRRVALWGWSSADGVADRVPSLPSDPTPALICATAHALMEDKETRARLNELLGGIGLDANHTLYIDSGWTDLPRFESIQRGVGCRGEGFHLVDRAGRLALHGYKAPGLELEVLRRDGGYSFILMSNAGRLLKQDRTGLVGHLGRVDGATIVLGAALGGRTERGWRFPEVSPDQQRHRKALSRFLRGQPGAGAGRSRE